MQWRNIKGGLPLVGLHVWVGCQHSMQAVLPFSVEPLSDPCILQSSSADLTPWKANYDVSEPPKRCCQWMDRGRPSHGHSHGKSAVEFQHRCLSTYNWVLWVCCFSFSCTLSKYPHMNKTAGFMPELDSSLFLRQEPLSLCTALQWWDKSLSSNF